MARMPVAKVEVESTQILSLDEWAIICLPIAAREVRKQIDESFRGWNTFASAAFNLAEAMRDESASRPKPDTSQSVGDGEALEAEKEPDFKKLEVKWLEKSTGLEKERDDLKSWLEDIRIATADFWSVVSELYPESNDSVLARRMRFRIKQLRDIAKGEQ